MLIVEVISASNKIKNRSTRKYKCTSGPRKNQRVAKPSTCTAPINHRSKSYNKDEGDQEQVRSYVPSKKKVKKLEKKKLRPRQANIRTESNIVEYGMAAQAKIKDLKPGQTATVDHGDGTETKIDLKKNPQALTKDEKGSIKLNTTSKPGQKPNAASIIKKGDLVDINNENK